MPKVTIHRQLPTLRTAFNYRSERVRNIKIAQCAASMFMSMSADGLASKLTPVIGACREQGRKLGVYITVGRNPIIRDHDNLISSANKLLIDPLVRRGYLPSDSDGVIDAAVRQERCMKKTDYIMLEFFVGPEPTTGAGWKGLPDE